MEEIESWKAYEEFVFNEVQLKFPNALIKRDCRKVGNISKTNRQIDIWISEPIGSETLISVVECKFYSRKVDLKIVESMIGMAQDLSVDQFFIVTNAGYTSGAIERAANAPDEIELEILTPHQLERFQSPIAIPYAGSCGAILMAPFGWIVDCSMNGPAPAFLYPTGLDLDTAIRGGEFMYLNFWNRSQNNDTIDDLVEIQARANVEYYGEYARPMILPHFARADYRTVISKSTLSETLVELKGYIDFPQGIAFYVAVVPAKKASLGLKKIKHVVWNTMPLTVEHR